MVYDDAGQYGAEDAGNGRKSVGYSQYNTGVLGCYVKRVDTAKREQVFDGNNKVNMINNIMVKRHGITTIQKGLP